VIEADVKNTKARMKRFIWFHYMESSEKKRHSAKVMRRMMIAIPALWAVIAVINIFFEQVQGFTVFIVLCFIITGVAVASITFYFGLPILIVKLTHKKDTFSKFIFYDEHFTVMGKDGEISIISELRYAALFEVAEFGNWFYLYVDKDRGYMVNRKDITKGTAEKLSALLGRVILPEKLNKC